jgi:hypothetical protein
MGKAVSIIGICLAIMLGALPAQADQPSIQAWVKVGVTVVGEQFSNQVSCVSQEEAVIRLAVQESGSWGAVVTANLTTVLAFVLKADASESLALMLYIGKISNMQKDFKGFVGFVRTKGKTIVNEAQCPWKISQKKSL